MNRPNCLVMSNSFSQSGHNRKSGKFSFIASAKFEKSDRNDWLAFNVWYSALCNVDEQLEVSQPAISSLHEIVPTSNFEASAFTVNWQSTSLTASIKRASSSCSVSGILKIGVNISARILLTVRIEPL